MGLGQGASCANMGIMPLTGVSVRPRLRPTRSGLPILRLVMLPPATHGRSAVHANAPVHACRIGNPSFKLSSVAHTGLGGLSAGLLGNSGLSLSGKPALAVDTGSPLILK